MLGHADAWNYGFSAFLAAARAAAKCKVELQKDIALAIANGVGLCFAKEDEQKKFLKGE